MEDLKNSKRIVGIKQSVKAIENGIVQTVYLAEDADQKVLQKIKDLCTENDLPIIYVESMKVLGKACCIEVGAAAACIVR